MKTIYTMGYAGKDPAKLANLVKDLDAVVFDVRFQPHSRDNRWAGWALRRKLGEGEYRHVLTLGNRNYKIGGPIEIVNLDAGIEEIEKCEKTVILLCACKDPKDCHRTVIALALIARGHYVFEAVLPVAPGEGISVSPVKVQPVQESLF